MKAGRAATLLFIFFSSVEASTSFLASKSLPAVSEVLSKPTHVMQALNSKVNSLEERMNMVQQQNAEAVKAQKADYESQLATQRSENLDIEHMNTEINANIKALRRANIDLRSKAQKLTKSGASLTAKLKAMQANLTTALEFSENALNSSGQMLFDAPELQVLEELSKKDDAAEEAHAHERALRKITKFSFLQIGNRAAKEPAKALDLLQSLASALEALSNEQNASQTSLKQAFEKEFQAGAERRESLLKEQVALNSTKAAESELQEKLLVAVTHLEQSQQRLSEKLVSLKSFATRLGSASMAAQKQAASLLQLGQEKHKNVADSLPKVSEVLSKPTSVFQSLSSKVNQLEERLGEVQQQGAAAVKADKAEYESKLADQHRINLVTERENEKISAQIEMLKRSTKELRSKGEQLTEACSGLRVDLKVLQANLSTAEEFANNALNSSEELLIKAPELNILEELVQKDAAAEESQAHEQRLSQVAGASKMSLLQTGAHNKKIDFHANDLLESLSSALEDLSKEQNASRAALNEAFQKEFEAGASRHQALLEEQAELNTTKSAATELEDRLLIAVSHLEQVHQKLSEQKAGLKAFATRFGSGPVVAGQHAASLLQVHHEKHNNKVSLPEVSEVLSKPETVYKALSSKVTSLEQRLSEMQQNSTAAMQSQSAEFKRRLADQHSNTSEIANVNSKLVAEIASLRQSNAELRSKSDGLKNICSVLKADLDNLQANITVAEEFVEKAVESYSELLVKAPELDVLEELAQKDAAAEKVRSHEQHLNLIAGTASMLQVQNQEVSSDELLESLSSALDRLSEERMQSEVSLKAAFDKEFHAGEEKQAALLAEQADLKKTKADAQELQERLTRAVSHLESSRDKLSKKSKSLRAFAQRLGTLTMPLVQQPKK